MIDDERSDGVQQVLAVNLRRLRVARHLSLSELARETGMSKATLSGIEAEDGNPTLETVARLSRALRASPAQLLEVPPLGEIRIVRASQNVTVRRDGVPQRPLDAFTPGAGGSLAELVLPAGHSYELAAGASGARAHVYVLEGKMIAGPAGRYTELGAGDYASFPADVPHVYEATHRPVRALLLTQAPGMT